MLRVGGTFIFADFVATGHYAQATLSQNFFKNHAAAIDFKKLER